MKTLLVEDDPGVRELIELLLAARGHDVVAVGDAEQAWEAIQSDTFPLIVLDWVLPGMDGLELCQRIRGLPDGDSSVILVITGRDRPEDLAAMLSAGANDYLAKPFDVSAFDVRLSVAERQVLTVEERKRAELLEKDRNQVLELIAKNEPLGDVLLQLACLVERQLPDLVCSVQLVRDDRLFHQAAPSLPERFLLATDARPLGALADACGTAADRSDAVVVADISCDPRAGAYRAEALRYGLRACWSVPICSGAGQVLGAFTLYYREPREPSEAELELLEMVSRLAALAIEHARLFDEAASVEGLRALTRLKSEFLSMASHELRTPLSLVHGYAELLMVRAQELSAEQVIDMAAEIHTGSRTMIRLVDDLLDFSRIEQGRLQLHPRPIDAVDTLSHLVETFRHQPGGEQLVAELPDSLEVTVDPERLAQVAGNLLSNALRYAPDGPIVLRAGRRRDALRVEVADQGPGIPPREQPRVWEKFYRGALAINSSTRGSGLGLAVVKHLVELQGGRVGLRSTPDQGTIFWFALPAADRKQPNSQAER